MKRSLFLILMCFLSVSIFAQARTLKGIVEDTSGTPLIGATVTVVGTKTGVITDIDGAFTISLGANSNLIAISYIGYEKKSVDVKGKSDVRIVLEEDGKMLDDLVVVGYGTQKRSDLTGSVASIRMEEIQKAPVKSIDEALAGRIAGVQVVSTEGQPGSAIEIVIRGGNSVSSNNSPLYVIDGFPVESTEGEARSNPLDGIDPADIESIDVLKDASATSIYGARGANGVVMITTKRGVAGKTTVSYNGYYGWQNSSKRLDVLDPYEFVKLQYELAPGQTKTYYLDKIHPDGSKETLPLEYYKNVKGIDWEDQIMRTAPMQNHHFSLVGGTETTKFNASLSYMEQQGIIKHSGFDRIQGRMGIDHQVNKRLRIYANASYSKATKTGTPVSTSNYNSELNLLFSVWAYRPISLLNSDVNLIEVPNDPEIEQGADFRYNPIITTKNELRDNTEETLTANAFLEYEIMKGLKARVSGGYTRRFNNSQVFNNSLSRTGNETTNSKVNGGQLTNNTSIWLNENTLTYKTEIDKHQTLDVVGGMTLQGSDYSAFSVYGKELPNESLGPNGIEEGEFLSMTATASQWTMASFLARANYSLRSKYLLTAAFRADGSSRFPDNNKWGYFGSGAIAWRLGEEQFIKEIKEISSAKVRLSWGMTGNNNIGSNVSSLQIISPKGSGYMFGNLIKTGSYPSAMGNPDLKWETTYQTDLGVDLGFFKERFGVVFDLYRKDTHDLLLDAALPTSSGFERQTQNIGQVRNEGLEITLNGQIVNTKKFRWDASFNIAFNKNKVMALGDGEYSRLTSQYWGDDWKLIPGYIARVGAPVAQFYGHIWDGVYQLNEFDEVGGTYILKDGIPSNGTSRDKVQPGHIKYKDINGDLEINDADKTVIGDPNPIHTGGFTNNFSYKNFDLSVFFQWSYGNDIYNANKIMLESGYKYNTNQFASYANRWSPENQGSNIPAAKGSLLKTYSTRIVEDGSFLRLKTVSVGYNFPRKMIKPLGISSLRVYMTGQNLYTWTSYSGYDPEVSVRRSALTPGFDYSAYPRARTITIGTNITF